MIGDFNSNILYPNVPSNTYKDTHVSGVSVPTGKYMCREGVRSSISLRTELFFLIRWEGAGLRITEPKARETQEAHDTGTHDTQVRNETQETQGEQRNPRSKTRQMTTMVKSQTVKPNSLLNYTQLHTKN